MHLYISILFQYYANNNNNNSTLVQSINRVRLVLIIQKSLNHFTRDNNNKKKYEQNRNIRPEHNRECSRAHTFIPNRLVHCITIINMQIGGETLVLNCICLLELCRFNS